MKQTFPINPGDTSVTVETLTVITGSATPPPPPTNKIPVVKAGTDQAIVLPANSVTLTGSATDPDTGGTISAYLWERLSGSGDISSPNSQNTKITSLKAGVSVFQLTAIDNLGASGKDQVAINVSTVTPPPPPPTPGYTETFRTGFDTMADILYGGNGQYGNGKISNTIFKTGPGSFASIPANVSSGIRSEVQYGGSQQNNEEGYCEWDVYYETITQDNCHSFQFHPDTSGGSASPGLWHINGKFNWVNWKNGGNTEHGTGITIQKNKWYHLRIEYKFGSNGYFRFFIDGVLNSGGSWTGQVGDNSGHYVKIGYNGFNSDSMQSRIFYDNFSVGKKI